MTLQLWLSDLTAQNIHDATTQQSSKHDHNNKKEKEQYNCSLERIDKIDKNSLLTGRTKSGAFNLRVVSIDDLGGNCVIFTAHDSGRPKKKQKKKTSSDILE